MGAPGFVPTGDPEMDLIRQQQIADLSHPSGPVPQPPPLASDLSPVGDLATVANNIPAATPPQPAQAPTEPPPQALPPVPLPAAPGKLTTDASTTTSTRTGIKETPALKEASGNLGTAVANVGKSQDEAIAAREKADLAGQKFVEDKAKLAADQVAADQQNQADQAALEARQAAAEQAAQKQVDAANQAIKGFKFHQLFEGKDGKVSWASKIGSALSVALGAYGAALTKTPNYALEILNRQMDENHQQQVDQLNQLKDQAVMARTGIADAREARVQAQGALNLKFAAGKKLIADQLEEAAARSNDQGYKDAVAARIAEMRKEAAASELAGKQLLYQSALATAPHTTSTTTTVKSTKEGVGVGGKGASDQGAALNAADAMAKLDADLGSLNSVIGTIHKDPRAWEEFRKNSEEWQRKEKASAASGGARELRGMLQGVGLADVSPEQGLKSPDAKLIHQGMQNALTSIAKGYGGVITQGDRDAAAAGLAILNQNPSEALRTLQTIQSNLESRRAAYGGVKGVPQVARQMAAAGGAQAPAPAAQIPPGAVPGTLNGKRGYALDGKFVALQ